MCSEVSETLLVNSVVKEQRNLHSAAHVEHILSVANQRMYLLAWLKSQGLSRNVLHIIFTHYIFCCHLCSASFAGQLSKADKARIDTCSL